MNRCQDLGASERASRRVVSLGMPPPSPLDRSRLRSTGETSCSGEACFPPARLSFPTPEPVHILDLILITNSEGRGILRPTVSFRDPSLLSRAHLLSPLP